MGKPFPEIQKELRNLLINGIDLAISAIKALLPEGTDKYKDLILLESRYRGVNQQLLQGVLSYDDSQLEFNKIRKALLDFIDELREQDFKAADQGGGGGPKDIYNGEVLYRIPRTMQIQQEVKCIVRVAFTKQVLLEGLEQMETDVVKDVRISDVMGVELLDPSVKTFQIRPFCETVQFVEKDLATEWIFYVTPLMEGIHPLMLRISVIEIINGIERKRNVVLEEKVQIITTAPAEEGGEAFRPAGVPVNIAGPTDSAAPTAPAAPASPPVSPGAPPVPAPAPQSTPDRRAPAPSVGTSFARSLPRVLGVLVLIIGIGIVAINYISGPESSYPGGYENNPTATKEWDDALGDGGKDTLEHYIEKYPDAPEAEIAKQNLLVLEASTFESAIASGDPAQVEAYVKTYGGSAAHSLQAAAVLMAMRSANNKDNFTWTFSKNTLSVRSRIPNLPYLVTVNRDTQIVSRFHQAEGEPLTVSLDSLKSGKYQIFFVPTYLGATPVKGFITIQAKSGSVPKTTTRKTTQPSTENKPANHSPATTTATTTVTKNNDPVAHDTASLTPSLPVIPPGENLPVPKALAARKPVFKGCERNDRKKEETCTERSIREFVTDRLEYPELALRKGIEGTITVEFIVEKDGSVSGVRARNDIGGDCAREAVKLVEQLPEFTPGQNIKGEPIRVVYLLPIMFKQD